MKIEKEEKVEKANVVINIQTAYNVNPAATKVENTFIIGSAKEANRALAEATGGRDGINPDVVRPEIIKYVSRVLPLLHDAPKGYFIKMWNDILDLPAVKDKVYNPGQQVGQIQPDTECKTKTPFPVSSDIHQTSGKLSLFRSFLYKSTTFYPNTQ